MGLKLVLGLALDSIVRWKRIQYFSLLWEKPQVPLEFPCVIEARIEFEAYPFLYNRPSILEGQVEVDHFILVTKNKK